MISLQTMMFSSLKFPCQQVATELEIPKQSRKSFIIILHLAFAREGQKNFSRTHTCTKKTVREISQKSQIREKWREFHGKML